MVVFVVAIAALAQAPEYVTGYKPKVGDKVVLARDEAGRKVPIAKSDGAALGFKDIIQETDSNYEAVVGGSGELTEIEGGTPAQIVENVKYLKEPIFFKVRILAGPFKGKTTYTDRTRKLHTAGGGCAPQGGRAPQGGPPPSAGADFNSDPYYAYATFCRKPDPAFAKATAERRKKRGSLDKGAIAAEVKDALAKAKPNDANEGLSEKKKIVREAVAPICEKHKADYKEINALATQAGVFVILNGEKYDVAGNRVRK